MMAMVLALSITLTASASRAEEQAPNDAVAATVNGTPISEAELEREVGRMMKRHTFPEDADEDEKARIVRNTSLDKLIERELLFQESNKMGLGVDDEAIKEHMATIRKMFGGDEAFEKRVADMGLTEEKMVAQFRRGKTVQQLIDKEILSKLVISDEDGKAYYDENPAFFQPADQIRASHILIKLGTQLNKAQKTEKLEKLDKIRARAVAGEDFAELAKEFSEGPSGPKGGDLGFFDAEQMVKPFADVAFAMEVGEVSEVVKTQFGFHIIKVFERKKGASAAYEDVKEQIDEILKRQRTRGAISNYALGLREKADVEIFSPEKP
jgi:peptidyl-prolyl cis-trans isomerase C